MMMLWLFTVLTKPDTRFDMLLQDLTAVVKGVNFKDLFRSTCCKAIVVKGAADNYSRKDIDKMTEVPNSMVPKVLLGQGG